MQKKKVVPIWVSVILIILIAASIVTSIIFVPQNASNGESWAFILIKVFESLTFVFALIYCFMGYKKNTAVHFKLFCGVYILYALTTIYGKIVYIIAGKSNIASVIPAIAICIMLWLIAFVENLGKVKSMSLAIAVVACEVINVLLSLNKIDTPYLITLIAKVALAVVFTLMIYAKYLDKASRGSK